MNNLKKRAEADASMNNSDETAAEHSVDRQLRGMFGFTDEMLLAEFEAAEKDTTELPIPAPPEDEFETIWSRIQAEADRTSEKEPKIIRIRFNWKRIAAIGLIACMMAGAGCFVALGRKSYFYRGKILGGDANDKVLVNDGYIGEINGEEEAYKIIEEELGIEPLKLRYVPSGMRFLDFDIHGGYAKLRFQYEDQIVNFVQSKYENEASLKSETDKKNGFVATNKWLNSKLTVTQESLTDGSTSYSTSLILGGAYYSIWGVMDKSEYLEMITRLSF